MELRSKSKENNSSGKILQSKTQNVTEEDNFFKSSKVNCTHQMSGMPRNLFVMNSCINSSTQLLLSVLQHAHFYLWLHKAALLKIERETWSELFIFQKTNKSK